MVKITALQSTIRMRWTTLWERKMSYYSYLIVGGGMTAAAAVKGIREIDTNGSIGLFSMESDPPYDRPPLSKSLWKGKGTFHVFDKLLLATGGTPRRHAFSQSTKRIPDTQAGSSGTDFRRISLAWILRERMA
jgi:NADPH-dependent 2,4-dienoyl-CoA reductase/sulfur reductase-like enzyme